MPDPATDLPERLAAARERLLDSIRQPALTEIAARADRLRRRRRYAGTGASLLAVLAVALVVAHPWQPREAARPTDPAASARAPAPIWRDQGITLAGLDDVATEFAGGVVDVEFVNRDRGYLLTADCAAGSCRLHFALTVDGGQSWAERLLPVAAQQVPDGQLPELWTAGDRVLVGEVAGGQVHGYQSDTAGADWTALPGSARPVGSVPSSARLWVPGQDAGPGLPGSMVLAWLPAGDALVRLSNQPPIDVGWAATGPAGDGAHWVGGMESGSGTGHGRPAVAVTRDAGRSWQATVLPEPDTGGYRVRVATLASSVYVAVLDSESAVRAMYRSADGGEHFVAVRHGQPALTLSGDLVALRDGRLLLITGDHVWYLSADGGATFRPAAGLLPALRILRTQGGYVAYDLLSGGWTAFSADGTSWHKINAR